MIQPHWVMMYTVLIIHQIVKMTTEYELLQEVLDTFQKVRTWANPDFYRQQVLPIVNKVKERVATIETEKFLKSYQPPPKPVDDEIPTIPSYLEEQTSKFGLFNNDKKTF